MPRRPKGPQPPNPDKPRQRGAWGQGAVYWRKDRQRWCADVAYFVNGKRKRKTVYGLSEAEVRRKMRGIQDALEDGQGIAPGRIRVKAWLTEWLEGEAKTHYRATTYALHRGIITTHLIPAFGEMWLHELDAESLGAYQRAKLAQGFGPAAIISHRVALSGALRHAIVKGKLKVNIIKLVPAPKLPRTRPKGMETDLARWILDTTRGTRFEAIAACALYLGLRRGEILALKWDDVLWKRGYLRVWDSLQHVEGKTQDTATKNQTSTRLLAMADGLVEALRSQEARQAKLRELAGKRWQVTGYVFTNQRGRPLNPTGVSTDLSTFLRISAAMPVYAEAGYPMGESIAGCTRWIREHPEVATGHETLRSHRHGFASFMFEEGAQLKEVSEAMGHASIRTTADIYTGLLPSSTHRLASITEGILHPSRKGLAVNIAVNGPSEGATASQEGPEVSSNLSPARLRRLRTH